MSLIRNVTFYLVAWLFMSSFLLPFAIVSATGGSQSHPCFPAPGKFKTYTQGQYGDSNSPASSILSQHFPLLFPNGIAIGANVFLNVNNILCNLLDGILSLLNNALDIVINTVDDVVAFLPQLGAPGVLVQNLVDPLLSSAGSLAGNALALALNVALDANVAVFSGTSACLLTDLYVVHGPCAGLSVSAVLDIANQLLGNTVPLPLLGNAPLTIAANVDVCLASINKNFQAGLVANAFLALPGLNLKAIVDVCLRLPVISAAVKLVVRGFGGTAPLAVQLNVGAGLTPLSLKAWKLGVFNIPANSPIDVGGLVLPLPSVVTGLLDGVLNLVNGLLDVVIDDTLCLVNYLLNNKPLNARIVDIQAAIILLLHPELNVQALLKLGIACNPQLVLAILADVRLNGVGFLPAPGQIVGVVAKVDVAGIHARVLLELALPALPLNVQVNTDLCIAL